MKSGIFTTKKTSGNVPPQKKREMIHLKLLDFPLLAMFSKFVAMFFVDVFRLPLFKMFQATSIPSMHPRHIDEVAPDCCRPKPSSTKATRFYETFGKIISFLFHLKTTSKSTVEDWYIMIFHKRSLRTTDEVVTSFK